MASCPARFQERDFGAGPQLSRYKGGVGGVTFKEEPRCCIGIAGAWGLDWHSFQVCGDAKAGKEAIDKVIELKPDIVILDINMPVMDGLTAAHEIRRISPATEIVFLTIQDAPGTVESTRLWAHGFVSKAAAGTQLIPTLSRLVATSSGKPPDIPSRPSGTPKH